VRPGLTVTRAEAPAIDAVTCTRLLAVRRRPAVTVNATVPFPITARLRCATRADAFRRSEA
jgi:hypothetical protein